MALRCINATMGINGLLDYLGVIFSWKIMDIFLKIKLLHVQYNSIFPLLADTIAAMTDIPLQF